MVSYYPQRFDIAEIIRKYPELELVDDEEEERLQDVIDRRKRGKGPPKKAKSKGAWLFFLNNVTQPHLVYSHLPSRQQKAAKEAVIHRWHAGIKMMMLILLHFLTTHKIIS